MKIAVSTHDNKVAERFEDCETLTLYTIGNHGSIESSEIINCSQHGVSPVKVIIQLKEKGIKVLLAGSMEETSFVELTGVGIRVFTGCSGNAQAIANAYVQGLLVDTKKQHTRTYMTAV